MSRPATSNQFPIRTLHCLPELKEGGLERGVVEKTIWLTDHGIGACVVSAGGWWVAPLTDAGIRHYELPIHVKNPLTVMACARKLRKIIRDEDIHLVASHSRIPTWAAHFATRNGHSHSPPLVVEAQGYYERHPVSRIMVNGERVIAVSSGIRDHLVRYFNADSNRISIIPRGLDFNRMHKPGDSSRTEFRDELGIPQDALLIAGVGRLTYTKGWDDLIIAVSKMKDFNPYCVLVGSANGRRRKYIRTLRKIVESLDLGDRVRFIGHRDDLERIYAAADCVAAPSRLPEPFGRVIIEALACNRPVITTRGCGAAEFLGSEFDRFVVPPGDPDSLAEKLRWVCGNREEVSGYVRSISETIHSELTIDRQMEATVEVYREVRPDLDWQEI